MLNTQTAYAKRSMCHLLKAPRKIPNLESVRSIFESFGLVKSVTKVVTEDKVLTVRTSISALVIMDIASLAEKLRATDVDISFSRSGLVFMFHYT